MSWKTIKIGDFLKERKLKFKPHEANSSGLKRIGKIDFSGRYHLVDKLTNTDMILVKQGDLLISGINAEKGAATIYQEDSDALATIHYSTYVVDKTKVDVNYLSYFLKSEIFRGLLKSQAGNGIKTELKSKHLLPLVAKFPSLATQKIITGILQSRLLAWEALNVEIEYQSSKVQLLRQVYLQEVINGRYSKERENEEDAVMLLSRLKAAKLILVQSGESKKEIELPQISENQIPFEIPKGWKWCRFSDVALIRSKLVDPKSFANLPQVAPDIIEKGTGRLKEIRTVRDAKVKSSNHYFHAGQILYSKIRPNLSKATIVDFEGLCSADMYPIESLINKEYLLHFILSKTFLDQVVKNDNRVKMPKINQDDLKKVLVPLPPLEEQNRIVLRINELLHYLLCLEHEIIENKITFQKLFEAILKEAVEEAKINIAALDPRKTLAGYIIHHLHKEKYFGLTKFQKTLFVAEHHSQVEWQMNYEQEVAGPYDRSFTKSFRKEMKEKDWFQEHTKVSMTHFIPGANVHQLLVDYQRSLADKKDKIESVLKLFKEKTLLESELIATLYAVWNNRILKKKEADLESLVEDIYAWSKRKSIYTKKHIATVYQWMLKVGLVPTGFGKEITSLEK